MQTINFVLFFNKLKFLGGGCRPWNLFLRWTWPQKSGLIWISSKKTDNCSKWVEFRAENVRIMTVLTFFEVMIKRTSIHSILKIKLSASEEFFFLKFEITKNPNPKNRDFSGFLAKKTTKILVVVTKTDKFKKTIHDPWNPNL